MITYSQYENYFLDIAIRFRPIGHRDNLPRFASMDIDDIISMSRTEMDMDNPCMILENPEGKLDYKHDKMLDENLGAFLIIQRAVRGDATMRRQALDNTKEIGSKIIAKIQMDKIARFKGLQAPRMVLYFDLSEVGYNKIGPIFSDCYGWRFTFGLGQEDALPYDAADWDQDQNQP
jgi:hypothetical protein